MRSVEFPKGVKSETLYVDKEIDKTTYPKPLRGMLRAAVCSGLIRSYFLYTKIVDLVEILGSFATSSTAASLARHPRNSCEGPSVYRSKVTPKRLVQMEKLTKCPTVLWDLL